jgi:hypothetical protein
MTRLRKMMLEEIQRRNYSQHITCYYISHSLGDLPHRCLLPFNLHRARVRRNHGRLRSNGLIEFAQRSMPSSTASQNARPIKH